MAKSAARKIQQKLDYIGHMPSGPPEAVSQEKKKKERKKEKNIYVFLKKET